MEEGSRKTALVIGAVAAAAGLAIASYLYFWRRRAANHGAEPPLRTVSELLNDCYAKMREIQSNLSALPPSAVQSPAAPG